MGTRTESQGHGFCWEKELLQNIYGASREELERVKYTSKMDLPKTLNRLDGCDLSVKTSCTPNGVCMADCLRIFDAVASGDPFHMVVLIYQQTDDPPRKRVQQIVEVDLTASQRELFGSVTREEIEGLTAIVRTVPQKRRPTPEEHAKIYAARDALHARIGAIHLNPKCDSQQSRLQCSFNRFQQFLADHPHRVVAQSTTAAFRGGAITAEIVSARRERKKKPPQN